MGTKPQTIHSLETRSQIPPTLREVELQASSAPLDIRLESTIQEPSRYQNLRLLIARVGWWLDSRRTPAMLISFIVHVLILILLAVVMIRTRGELSRGFELSAVQGLDANLQFEMPLAHMEQSSDSFKSTATDSLSLDPTLPTSQEQSQQLIDTLQSVDDSNQSVSEGQLNQTHVRFLEASKTTLSASFAVTSVAGRDSTKRTELAQQLGGTRESEAAVELALAWLAEHQLPSGAWSLVHSAGPCNGRCSGDGSPERFAPAATGLSLLAFLGAGYTHRNGKYRDTVRRGLYFLQQIQENTPQGGSFLFQSERGMYNHGIAAFAICEAYQMTDDPELENAAQQATQFITSAQGYHGGWGYLPKAPGDLTISGWQIMALKSASSAGLDVPPTNILNIDPFLDSQTDELKTYYGYRKPDRSPTCTAIGLLIRLFRDWSHTDPRILEGAEFLHDTGPAVSDVYFNYYTTLFLFHIGGPLWESWNPRVRDFLVNTQATAGHESGSWYFDNPFGREGGRLYTTAMAAMTLEVYYRFSPLYQQSERPFEL
ncbi:MAG: hypothetical protein KDB03_02905 [Planctomycetales bacterium]|nr:hypothetical protein [Planctomycetales bacterium]